MARPRSALSKFILALPHDLPVKEVIAKAKAKGMKASENNVYRVRRLFGKAGKVRPKVPAKARKISTPGANTSTSKAKPASSARVQSKAAFIRSLPAGMSAKEAVKAGASKGVKFDSFYVYSARRAGKGSAKKKMISAKTRPGRNGAAVPSPITTSSSRAEDLLRAVAAEIGLGRAVEILSGVRARVRAAIGHG